VDTSEFGIFLKQTANKTLSYDRIGCAVNRKQACCRSSADLT